MSFIMFLAPFSALSVNWRVSVRAMDNSIRSISIGLAGQMLFNAPHGLQNLPNLNVIEIVRSSEYTSFSSALEDGKPLLQIVDPLFHVIHIADCNSARARSKGTKVLALPRKAPTQKQVWCSV